MPHLYNSIHAGTIARVVLLRLYMLLRTYKIACEMNTIFVAGAKTYFGSHMAYASVRMLIER
jgi:hypothetical protein